MAMSRGRGLQQATPTVYARRCEPARKPTVKTVSSRYLADPLRIHATAPSLRLSRGVAQDANRQVRNVIFAMTSQTYKSMGETTSVNMDEYRVFIVGKTGNGKSSLGNVILGNPEFPVGSSMASTTTRVHQAVGSCDGERLRVIDTPDPVNLDLSDTAIKDEVARWKSLATGRFAILLAVRCDVRYTAEEHDIYKKIKSAWGDNSFRDHLVVTFTFGDRQDRDIDEELRTVCWELQSILTDARKRYVVFNNKAYENDQQVRRLLHVLHDLERRPPHLLALPSLERQPSHLPALHVPERKLPPPNILLLILLLAVIAILAVWFFVPWHSDILKVTLPVVFVVGCAIVCYISMPVLAKRVGTRA